MWLRVRTAEQDSSVLRWLATMIEGTRRDEAEYEAAILERAWALEQRYSLSWWDSPIVAATDAGTGARRSRAIR